MVAKLKMHDIAKKTGYSVSTVSRVLSGTAYASGKARDAIISCARELGVLDVLGSGHLLIKGVVIFAPARAFTAAGDAFYHEVIKGISDTVERHNVYLNYCGLEEDHSDIKVFLERINNKNVNAAIIIGVDDPTVHKLASTVNKPCVLVNSQDKQMLLDAVSPDQHSTGYSALQHLFEEGHRRILTITSMRRETFYKRLAGTRDAYRAYHVDFDSDYNLLITEGLMEKEAEQALERWLKVHPRDVWPEAIFCQGKRMVSGVRRVLQRYGLRVPEDISLIATDYALPQDSHTEPPVTSLTIPCRELGIEAIHLLQTRFSRPEAPVFNLMLKGKLEAHGTVARSTKNTARSVVADPEE
ncbi:LacI family DNA-binding transcriptional regulator [Klebsiella aerogenes]|nr:LacI family DNA-binding transcriptional regulator [Klebsiella aerogenes]